MKTPLEVSPVEPTALAVPIGPRVLELLDVAWRARRPVLLEGPTGIGKSQIVAQFAASRGLAFTMLDLSLLEPPDLVGLPVIREGRTHFASPAELPTSGSGVLMLEELNRAELPVMQPALQLLSARRLHSYELPPGWVCVAAVNPEDGDYQVNHLDPALRSRFLQLTVCALRDTWLPWARQLGVHPVVLALVAEHDDVFTHASPRSWAWASEVLQVLSADEAKRPELVRPLLRGYLPAAWAQLVTEALAAWPQTPAFEPERVFGSGGAAELARFVDGVRGRPDVLAMTAARVRRALASDAFVSAVDAGTLELPTLEATLAALPGDLRDQCLLAAVDTPVAARWLPALVAPERLATAWDQSTRELVQRWKAEAKLHRVRLAALGLRRWLEVHGTTPATLRNVKAFVAEAGPAAGAHLARWLE